MTDFDCPDCSKSFDTAVALDSHLDSFHYTSLAEVIDEGRFLFINSETVGHEHYHCIRCGEQYRTQDNAKACCQTTGAVECNELGCIIDPEKLQ